VLLAWTNNVKKKAGLEHFQQKYEASPQGNQFAGLISFPAAMRRKMRKTKQLQQPQRFSLNWSRCRINIACRE